MSLYQIEKITEADFGCEECPADGPHAYLYLNKWNDEKENEKNHSFHRIEVSEKWISENGLSEGRFIDIDKDGTIRKAIRVVAAVIIDNKSISGKTSLESLKKTVNKRIFATKRGYGEFKGGWEFPGGKIEEGETPREALMREIKEEIDVEIEVGRMIDRVEYNYPTFHLSMDCFECVIENGSIILKEHEDAKWLCLEELESVEWLPADEGLIEVIKRDW